MKLIWLVAALLLPILSWAPPAARSEPLRQPDAKPVELVLGRRHHLTADGVPTTLGTLVATLDRLTGVDHARPILVRAPSSTSYGEVMEIMSRLDQGGYQRVALMTLGAPSR